MAEQYVASDKRTGVEVAVTGDFPPHPDDRMRIARTTTMFTRLMSTLLDTANEAERRAGFRAVETQLELADALIRRNTDDVRRLVQQTMESMGVTREQLEELAQQLKDLSGLDDDAANQFAKALGLDDVPPDAGPSDGGAADGGTPEGDLSPEEKPGGADPATDSAMDSAGEGRPDWPPPPGARTEDASDDVSGGNSSDDPGNDSGFAPEPDAPV